MRNNCYHMTHDGTPVIGIGDKQGLQPGNEGLLCGAGTHSVHIPFVSKFQGGGPRLNSKGLVEARPVLDGMNICKGLEERGDWDGVLLYIATFNLEFSPGASVVFDINNAWPGAEIFNDALAQYGGRSNADQVQLIAVEYGQYTIVCDRAKRYMLLRWTGSQFKRSIPSANYFGKFLVLRAKTKLYYSFAGLRWTEQALKDIGQGALWTGSNTLPSRLQELEAKLR